MGKGGRVYAVCIYILEQMVVGQYAFFFFLKKKMTSIRNRLIDRHVGDETGAYL